MSNPAVDSKKLSEILHNWREQKDNEFAKLILRNEESNYHYEFPHNPFILCPQGLFESLTPNQRALLIIPETEPSSPETSTLLYERKTKCSRSKDEPNYVTYATVTKLMSQILIYDLTTNGLTLQAIKEQYCLKYTANFFDEEPLPFFKKATKEATI